MAPPPPAPSPVLRGTGVRPHAAAAPRWLSRLGCVLHRVGREPVGVLVPVVALAIMLAAPQMPDMFAGMLRPRKGGGWTLFGFGAPVGLGPAVVFGLAALFLGLSGWFWTRAALMAPSRFDDTTCRHAAQERRREDGATDDWVWADEWTPRLPLFTAALLAAAPGLLGGQDEGSGPPLLAIAIGLCLNVLGFAVVVRRHRWHLSGSASAGQRWRKGWLTRPTSVLLAAPCGGVPTAAAVLALSGLGIWVVADRPWWLEGRVPTPTAALLALGMVIGWLVLALALVRDLVGLLLACVFAPTTLAYRPIRARLRPGLSQPAAVWTRPQEIGLANGLGLFVFLAWLYLVPPPFVAANELYAIRRIADSALEEPSGPCRQVVGDPAESQEAGLPRRPCLDEALAAYRAARLGAGHPKDRPLPLIILAAEGGASRAAAWTLAAARMLDEETGGAFGRHLFGISGVSGGSLGAVSYLQYLRAQPLASGNVDWNHERIGAALDRLATGDLLVASLATYFLNDTFARLVGGAPILARTDRGVALELAFERHWADPAGLRLADGAERQGLLAIAANRLGWTPHLLLNGTDAATGRRVITSTFRFDPADDIFAASDDLLGILRKDVPAATAVTNSARFPYVSPAGRFTDREARSRQVLDGGYFENYGARTAAELARAVAERSRRDERAGRGPRLVPFVVVVSNDAEGLRGPRNDAPRADRSPPTLEEASVACPDPRRVRGDAQSGEQAIGDKPLYPEADPRRPLPVEAAQRLNRRQSGSFAAEFLAPVLGLYAIRGAHGQDALHLLRRDLCPVGGEGAPRMFHLALPRPDWEGEAAPMNWVLNDDARRFLLEVAPRLVFNVGQAHGLRAAMAEVARRPAPDAGSQQAAGSRAGRAP